MRATRKIAAGAAVAALTLLAAACTGSGSGTSGPGTAHASPAAAAKPTASATASGPRVAITPGNGSAGVNPSAGITVTATRGTLTEVSELPLSVWQERLARAGQTQANHDHIRTSLQSEIDDANDRAAAADARLAILNGEAVGDAALGVAVARGQRATARGNAKAQADLHALQAGTQPKKARPRKSTGKRTTKR